MSIPAVNFSIEKQTDFSLSFVIKENEIPVDITNYQFSSKMRKHFNASNSYSFSVQKQQPYNKGKITIGLASSITSTIPNGRYVYDILGTVGIGTTAYTSKYYKGTIIVEGTST